MKKSWMKRAVSVGLTFAMVLGMAGCGKGGDKMENAALAKEHVYKFQEIEIPDLGGDDYSIRGSVYRDGTIYLMAQVYHWSENSDDIDMKMLTLKDDGSEVQLVNIEIPDWKAQSVSTEPEGGDGADGGSAPEDGAASGAEGESGGDAGAESEDGAASGAEGESGGEAGAEGEDGAGSGAEGEDGTESGEDTGSADIIDDDMLVGGNDLYENSYYGNFGFGANGMIYALRNYYYEDYSGEEYTSVQKNYISCWNADGSFAWEKELEGLVSEDEYIYVNTMTVSQDGTLSLLLSGDNSYIKIGRAHV